MSLEKCANILWCNAEDIFGSCNFNDQSFGENSVVLEKNE